MHATGVLDFAKKVACSQLQTVTAASQYLVGQRPFRTLDTSGCQLSTITRIAYFPSVRKSRRALVGMNAAHGVARSCEPNAITRRLGPYLLSRRQSQREVRCHEAVE